MATNIKGFLLTFSFLFSFFESCSEEVSKTGKVQAAFTCEQVARVYIINVNAQNAMFSAWYTQLFHSTIKTAATTNDNLGIVMGSSFEKCDVIFRKY